MAWGGTIRLVSTHKLQSKTEATGSVPTVPTGGLGTLAMNLVLQAKGKPWLHVWYDSTSWIMP